MPRRFLSLLLALLASSAALAAPQGTAEDYLRADELPRRFEGLLRNERIEIRWLDADTPVYRYELPREDGVRRVEWRRVDLDSGAISPAFDAAALADAARTAGIAGELAWFDALGDGRTLLLLFDGDPALWRWDPATAALDRADPAALPDRFTLAPQRRDRTSGGGPSTRLLVVNGGDRPLRLLWLDHEGRERPYATVAPGATHRQHTYTNHAWRVRSADPDALDFGTYLATERPGVVLLGATPPPPPAPPAETRRDERRSPDGRFRVDFRDHQVVLSDQRCGTPHPLTDDGDAGDRYEGPVIWSPDSTRFVVLRTRPGSDRTIPLVESAPRDQLQPRLHSVPYRKPGDAIDLRRPRLFDAEARREIAVPDLLETALAPAPGAPVAAERDIEVGQPWSVGRIEWSPDGSRIYALVNARGHRSLHYIAIDGRTGAISTIASEHSDTFIDWTNKVHLERLDESGELLWASQRSGWNHLYRIDLSSGEPLGAVTEGPWVLRSVEAVDPVGRTALLRVMGVRSGEDPYHIHLARACLDGGGVHLLTEGDGTHEIEFSPDGRFFIDRWSRVDRPPTTEIRRTEDGARIALLAEADDADLRSAGWTPPRRFVAAGRDGVVEIWGVIHAPISIDSADPPTAPLPVVESIYAGPHGHHVPKAFSVWSPQRSLAELGFAVVQIDGMGTNWRSKAFHDLAHRNLADSGFPDRIPWIRAAAAAHPWIDATRVGIYGTSAGGQSALAALLFHGDVYSVAVADCGCHDNRMDKIWWNEQWMGWPVDEAYAASSNVEHAHRLQGRLLLTVGELDRNVDPASTMQVVDALIRADKDFDLVVFPGVGHGTLGTPYGTRRLRDFLVRHLHGVEPRR